MFKRLSDPSTNVAVLLIILVGALSLIAAQAHTLILNGNSTDVLIIFVNGHPYADLEALANVLKGSVSSSGAMVALSLPIGAANRIPSSASSAAPPPAPGPVATQVAPSNPGFSREFLNAGIEQMSTLREWHTALQTAIQNGIPLSAGLLQPYRARATSNLRLANVAINTPADRDAYQLLNNVFMNMGKLSDKYVNMRANMIYIAPDALQNDDLDQRIISCGRFLGAMAASGQFSDDGSCH